MKLIVSAQLQKNLYYTNTVYVCRKVFEKLATNYVSINGGPVYKIGVDPNLSINAIACGSIIRDALKISIGRRVNVLPQGIVEQYAGSISISIKLLGNKKAVLDKDMLDNELQTFEPRIREEGQLLILDYCGSPLKLHVLDMDIRRGMINVNTDIYLTVENPNLLTLRGSEVSSIITPNFDFQKLGIGGLSDEFSDIFRRAFASRTYPPKLVKKLGIQHVKGLLLYGPPGTGKTLMARQIGKMLNCNEPKVVNGPEILSKYVGQSEENIRNLFADAESEWLAHGEDAGLHIIIFDEIDAICKQRTGRGGAGANVQDGVVNQMLSKMDGVNSIPNVLVIGITNRKDIIDEALLRPGRFEVQVYIGLPNEEGRREILNIHTQKLQKERVLCAKVSIDDLAVRTKNFSGAELSGLVRSAISFAYFGCVDLDSDAPKKEYDKVAIDNWAFDEALKEVVPSFGSSCDKLKHYIPENYNRYGDSLERVINVAEESYQRVRDRTRLFSLLIHGPSGSGKTSLACMTALKAEFPFTKMITPDDYVGMHDEHKCAAIKKVFDDAYRSQLSLIILDNIERLIGYVDIGPWFSNQVVQCLLVLLKKKPKSGRLMIVGTSSNKRCIERLGIYDAFMNDAIMVEVSDYTELANITDDATILLPATIKDIMIQSGQE